MTEINWQSITPEDFLEVLFVAANAKTDEEKTRIAWRASDYMWWKVPRYPIGFCRILNDLVAENHKVPRIRDLWSKEEREEYLGVALPTPDNSR